MQTCNKVKIGSKTKNKQYDNERTAYLEAQGLQVVRFTNLDILHRFRDVCEAIDQLMEVRAMQNF